MHEYGESNKASKREKDGAKDDLSTVQPVPVITDPQSARQALDQISKVEGGRNQATSKSLVGVSQENRLK